MKSASVGPTQSPKFLRLNWSMNMGHYNVIYTRMCSKCLRGSNSNTPNKDIHNGDCSFYQK